MGSLSTNHAGIRCLLISQRAVRSLVAQVEALHSALFMGVLRDEDLQHYDTYPFDASQPFDMRAAALGGLELWERETADRYFRQARSLLVVAAGGGREVIGLKELGFRVEGIDFCDELVSRTNDALKSLGAGAQLTAAPRFELPYEPGRFDGAVIARKFYSMIHDRPRRIEFLRNIRRLVPPGAPVLLSYFTRCRNTIAFRMQAALANLLRRLTGRRPNIEIGDHLDPDSPLLHHHFTPAEIREEFEAAGFVLARQHETWFGYAVGTATNT